MQKFKLKMNSKEASTKKPAASAPAHKTSGLELSGHIDYNAASAKGAQHV